MQKNSSVLSNLAWKFSERILAQLVSLTVSIILARLLSPSDYGVIAIVMIFITFANVFVSDGWGSALIQKKNADSLDFYSVLYFTVFLSVILYAVLFFAAPLISTFYGKGYEILTPVLRVLGLRLILTAINSVQQAAISRKMEFKKFFFATIIGTIISAIVGIFMAYSGFGVWSLVAQYLVNSTVDTLVLFIVMKSKIKFCFSFKRIKELFSFGIKILGSKLLLTSYQELRSIIIGKMYSPESLAFYDKGKQFPSLVVTNIDASIGAVLFPKMSSEQDNKDALKQSLRNSIRFSSFLLSPLMLGLAAVAVPFITIVLTDKWLPCAKLLQLFCVCYLFQPINTANLQAIKSMGKGTTILILEVLKIAIQLAGLLMVINISVEAIVIVMTVLNVLLTFINIIPNKKYLDYGVKEQLFDILPTIFFGLIMFICVSLIGKLKINIYIVFILQIVVGAAIYFLLCAITKNKEFLRIKQICKGFIKRKK